MLTNFWLGYERALQNGTQLLCNIASGKKNDKKIDKMREPKCEFSFLGIFSFHKM